MNVLEAGRSERPRFELVFPRRSSKGARRGRLTTAHGAVSTPAFMPVATQGAVKALTMREVEELGAERITSCCARGATGSKRSAAFTA
jgi:hypothetical protein